MKNGNGNNGIPILSTGEVANEPDDFDPEEVMAWARKMAAAGIESGCAAIPLDMPGVWLGCAHGNDHLPPRVLISVTEEMVRNLKGPDEERDCIILIHIPRSLQEKVEGDTGIVMPDLVVPRRR